MLIEGYRIEVSTPACDLESEVYLAKVTLDQDIAEVLPYVNAQVEKGEFIQKVPVLVWKEGPRKYALRAREMAISNITDKGEAEGLAQDLVRRINETWENRESIAPSYVSYERPRVLDVFKLLPRTNCGECGLPTCMAFADSLCKGKIGIEQCGPVRCPQNAGSYNSLKEMGL